MKRNLVIALLTLSTLGMAISAQAQQPSLQVNVPFAFNLGDKTLPANVYKITSPDRAIVAFHSVGQRDHAMAIAMHNAPASGGPSRLVFAKYGDQYFLRSIDCTTNTTMNLRVPVSNREKKARSRELAMGQPEQIVVAAL